VTTRPSPGTPQYRALALLETMPPGTEVTTAQWAECMGEPPANVRHYFEQLLEAGLVSMRQKNQHQRAPMFWTINAAAQCKPAANPPPQRESAVAAAPDVTWEERASAAESALRFDGEPDNVVVNGAHLLNEKQACHSRYDVPTCRWPKCKCMSVCSEEVQRRGGVESRTRGESPLQLAAGRCRLPDPPTETAGVAPGPRHPTGLRLALKLEIEREGQSHLLTLEEAHQLTKDGEAVGEFLRRHLREVV